MLRPGPLPKGRMGKVEPKSGRSLGSPHRVAEGDAPGMTAGREHRDAQEANDEPTDHIVA